MARALQRMQGPCHRLLDEKKQAVKPAFLFNSFSIANMQLLGLSCLACEAGSAKPLCQNALIHDKLGALNLPADIVNKAIITTGRIG
jgi:hypothetical protein